LRRYHEVIAEHGKPQTPVHQPPDLASPAEELTAAELLDKYLEWCKSHRSSCNWEWYHHHIQDFINRKRKAALLPFSQLSPFHLVEWSDEHKGWGAAYYCGAVISIQRPFNWAEQMGHISASRIQRIPRPEPLRRE
jgi:hypothetical protein